jgi:hypothetical protein
MAILRRSSKGSIKRRPEKDSHGVATFARSRDQRHNSPKIRARASISLSPDQLYLAKIGDTIEAGLLQLACHVSHYAESTFSQFCQEYLLDTARRIWWESNHLNDAEPSPQLDVVLPRFFDRLKSTIMAHGWCRGVRIVASIIVRVGVRVCVSSGSGGLKNTRITKKT